MLSVGYSTDRACRPTRNTPGTGLPSTISSFVLRRSSGCVAPYPTPLHQHGRDSYSATLRAGGCQVPWPTGRMDGSPVFGQYIRIAK
jgi:hypothetical protein